MTMTLMATQRPMAARRNTCPSLRCSRFMPKTTLTPRYTRNVAACASFTKGTAIMSVAHNGASVQTVPTTPHVTPK
eukprot:695450-Rhodomonas_salina.1